MLGDFIKNARKSKMIMQKDLAAMLNVRPSTVSMWEAGTRTPDVQTIIKIAEVLEIPFSRLMNDMSGVKNEKPLEPITLRASVSEWTELLNSLSDENLIKLRDYAQLLILQQHSQAEKEDQGSPK